MSILQPTGDFTSSERTDQESNSKAPDLESLPPWAAQLARLAGGSERGMYALAESFVQEVPELCDLLVKSIDGKQWSEARRAAHTIKSCLKYVTNKDEWQRVQELEDAARDHDELQVRERFSAVIQLAEQWTQRASELLSGRETGS